MKNVFIIFFIGRLMEFFSFKHLLKIPDPGMLSRGRLRIFLMFGLPLIFLTGCSWMTANSARINQTNDPRFQMADFPSERRGAWIVENNNKDGSPYIICSEPPSDVQASLSNVFKLTAALKRGDNASIDNALTSTTTELKGRSSAVLALRDVMYRLCEARLFGGKTNNIPTAELEIYKSIVSVIGDFANADFTETRIEKARVSGGTSVLSATPRDNAQAKKFEEQGYAALAEADWKTAWEQFNNCENVVVGFRACYDMAYAIRTNDTDADKAKGVLRYKYYLPKDALAKMQSLASP